MVQTPDILTVPDQRSLLVATRDLPAYVRVTNNLFEGESIVKEVGREVRAYEQRGIIYPEDNFSLLMLTNLLSAQFGFDSLIGQRIRYTRTRGRRPMLGPQHQAETAVYLAGQNKKAAIIKGDLIRTYGLDAEEFAGQPISLGIWGTKLKIDKGEVKLWDLGKSKKHAKGALVNIGRERLKERRPIALPDFRLHSALAGIEYTLDEAAGGPTRVYLDEVYPRMRNAVNKVTAPQHVFAAAQLSAS